METLQLEKQKENLIKPTFYRKIAGLQIAFYESKGKGETILLIHGNSSNSDNYKFQLNSELGKKHHLIAFDFPGCGNSEFSDQPQKTYGLFGLADILLEIIKSIDHDCWLVGHSLGSNVALLAAQKDQHFVKGFFLSGLLLVNKPDELSQAALPDPALSLFFKEYLTDQELQQVGNAGFFKPTSERVNFVIEGFKITDPNFRKSIATLVVDPNLYLGHKEYLKTSTLPVAIAEGTSDRFINFEYLEKQEIFSLWRHKVQVVDDAGHYVDYENPEAVITLIDQFISQSI